MIVRTKKSFNFLTLDALCRFSQRLRFNFFKDQKVFNSYDWMNGRNVPKDDEQSYD